MGESDFRQLSFQLIGRLSSAREGMAGVEDYVKSVREWTERPYMMPVEGCLKSVDESVEEVYIGSQVSSVALLPDANRVIVGTRSGEVLLVDVRLAEVVKRYVGHTNVVHSVAVSRNGRWMVSGSWDGTVRRWDVEGGVGIGDPLIGHEGWVYSVAVNEDHGLIASGSWDRSIRLWRMSIGELLREPLHGHEDAVRSVALSSDGERVVSCSSDKTIRVWSVRTGKEVMDPLRGHDETVTSVAVSRNNEYIVSGLWDGTPRLGYVKWQASQRTSMRLWWVRVLSGSER